MKDKKEYIYIRCGILENAKQRVLEEIDDFSNGNTEKIFNLVNEYNELAKIMEEIEEKKEKQK